MRKLLPLLILAAGCTFGQIGIGISIGAPPAPRHEVRPRSPGADFVWVDGYYYPEGKKYVWHKGYWSRPPYAGAHWVAPRHDGKQFYAGYWDGDHRVEHDHKSDRDRDRDFHH